MTAHGTFHWNELLTRDVAKAKQFYQDTIGWRFEGMPMAHEGGRTYWVAMMDTQPVAGMFELASPGFDAVPEGWMSYLSVDNVDARVEKAIGAGAQLMRPIFDVPDVGRIAILREPGGAGIGWMTPAQI